MTVVGGAVAVVVDDIKTSLTLKRNKIKRAAAVWKKIQQWDGAVNGIREELNNNNNNKKIVRNMLRKNYKAEPM